MMGFNELFARLADDGEPESRLEGALQSALGAASPLYGAGAFFNRFFHEVGWKERRELPAVVLSVGNITVGGTGKTPFCIWLVNLLKEKGRRPALLSRGYGREDEEALVVVHDGRRLKANAREAGDEPVLLAQRLGDVPVVACADRYRAGRALLRRTETDVLVLDDGFQHHRLDRQGDIVLVDATRPLSSLKLFPRGTLREPLNALNRAHLIVVTRWDQADDPKRVYREIRRAAPAVAVVRSRMVADSATRVASGEILGLDEMRGRKCLLICAVGNPESVRQTVREAGIKIAASKFLPDHEPIHPSLLRRAEEQRQRTGADFVLVTEKDAVKLERPERLSHNIVALRARLEMLSEKDEHLARKVIGARLHSRRLAGYLK